ncbi:PGPGW domain-containing protein, partial [Actinomadura adrarensis]
MKEEKEIPAPPPVDADRPGIYVRCREYVRRNALLNTTWRIGVFTVGATVLVGGLVMMIAPGPGLLGIVVGLAILATEFAWA